MKILGQKIVALVSIAGEGVEILKCRGSYGKLCQQVMEAAMATMNVSLPDEMKDWIESRMADGKYANSSDFIRDLVRRDRVREEAIARINALIDEGVRSGFLENYNPIEHRKKLRKQFGGETKSVA